MIDLLLYIGCGLSAGILGGYLGLGGGIVMVPYLTIVSGLEITAAVPISVSAIVVNSIASSTEYLRKGMVDLELVIILAVFLTMGTVTGSIVSDIVKPEIVRIIFTILLIYTSFAFIRNKQPSSKLSISDNRKKYLPICSFLIFLTGVLAGLLGVGGGVVLIPILFLVIGLPLSTARGTSAFMIGFSAAAATAVYYMKGDLNVTIAAAVILGIILGGKIGGYLGTTAKPVVVRVIFFMLMLYLAFKLGYDPILEIL